MALSSCCPEGQPPARSLTVSEQVGPAASRLGAFREGVGRLDALQISRV